MSEPRIVATAAHYGQLLEIIRRRIDELELSYETVESIAGLQPGYLAKLLGPRGIKRMGPYTIFLICEALGLCIALHEDSEALLRVKNRLVQRTRPKMHTGSVHKTLTVVLHADLLRIRAKQGGENSRKNLPKRYSRQLARKAAQARWGKSRAEVP